MFTTTNQHQATDEDDDDYDYDNDLVIEGNIGEIPYRLYEIDIEPSELWTHPPTNSNSSTPSFNPASLLSQFSSSSDTGDQECDPRIKYYANKANASNVANFQQLLIQQQQQQQAAMSPNATANSTNLVVASQVKTEPALEQTVPKVKPARADPRLAGRAASNLSPTRSITPPIQIAAPVEAKTDLISIQNRQVSVSSLLSSLPDFQFPKDVKSTISTYSAAEKSVPVPVSNEPSTVKLSIADYKRKTQKPTLTMSNNTTTSQLINSLLANNASAMSSLANNVALTSMVSNVTPANSNSNNSTSTLPSIPSYSVNLQAPQSLHELFRNFQS